MMWADSYTAPRGRQWALVAVAHLNTDAVGNKVLAQGVTCLQQGLPLQALLLPGLPGGLSCGQGELPDLEPESD